MRPAAMPLVLAVHTVLNPSATVPFAVILLQDHISNKKVPADLKCRQVRNAVQVKEGPIQAGDLALLLSLAARHATLV